MNTELRKRLEDAADIYAKRIWENLLEVQISKTDFLAGAELGYKEAIEVVKEWMQNYFPDELDGKGFEFVSRDEVISDFETDMNKIWEGQQ